MINPNKVFATGSLRHENLKKTFKQNYEKSGFKKIIFYSFQHNSIIDGDPREKYEKMPAFGERGLVNFFKNTHNLVIDMAQKNPNIKVKIKIKWPGKWEKTILDNWKQFSAKTTLPKNCEIISTKFNSKIFQDADLIISWVSTTILESFLLNKPILIPKFDEAKEKYDNYIDLTEYKNACTICNNKNKFIDEVKENLLISNVGSEVMSQRKHLMEKYLTADTNEIVKETKKRILEFINLT